MKILFVLSVFYFAVTGWGRLLAWVTCSRKARLNNEIEIYHLFSWLGLPAIFIVASTYNWFLPISTNFSRAILLIGLVSFAQYFAQHWEKLKFEDLVIFAASLTAGYCAQGREIINFDSKLYHIPLILWHQSEPVVLGLANLHSRFGFNPAWLTISSTFYFPGLDIRAIFLGQALLPMLLTGFVLKQIASTQSVNLRLFFFFFATLVGILVNKSLKDATSNDTVAELLVIMSCFLFVTLLDRCYSNKHVGIYVNDPDKTKPLTGLLTLCTISALAIMTKLSAAPVAIFIIAFLIIGKSSSVLPKISLRIGWCLTLMSVLWLAQNFALTGCLAYPVSFTCTNSVDWAVGADSAKYTTDVIRAWPRRPGVGYMSTLGNLDWIPHWYLYFRDVFFKPYLRFSFFVILLAVFIRFFKTHIQRKSTRQVSFNSNSTIPDGIPLLVCLAGLALWTVAPDPRFAFGFFVLLPPSLAYLLLPKEHVNESGNQMNLFRKRTVVSAFLVAIIFLLVLPPKHDNLEIEFSDAHLLFPTTMKTTQSGEVIRIPMINAQCGTAPPPCTPSFPDALSREPFLWLSMWKIKK